MIFKSIIIREGFFSRKIDFDENVNLIFSKKNSRGKTTLLRFILYSLGYNIPNTKNIKFEQCDVETVIHIGKNKDITLIRSSLDCIVLKDNDNLRSFILASELNELHSIIFNTKNDNILNNILGTFYVDQEKGWTLLNRGVVIGSIHFNIEEFIRGLSNVDCSKLISNEKKISRELAKYRQMFSISEYQKSIEESVGSIVNDKFNEKNELEIEQLNIQKNQLKKELKRLDDTISSNNKFKKYIEDMKLVVRSPKGEEFLVSSNNIVGFNDTMDLLITKHKLISSEISMLMKNIEKIQSQMIYEDEQESFFDTESITQNFDRKIASLQFNSISVEKEIKRLELELKKVRKDISCKTKDNHEIINYLYEIIANYLKELEVLGENEKLEISYLFTSNLKELSGAVLHKTVFAFRLAYIKAAEKILDIKLPIILDSPSGKEVDPENIQLMMNILQRDFPKNQIIIASIFTYKFDKVNMIEIKDRLIEE